MTNLQEFWMQRPVCLKGIPGIVFKLGMPFGSFFLQMTKYYFHYAHMQLQSDEDTGSKIHLLDMKNNNAFFYNLTLFRLVHRLLTQCLFLLCVGNTSIVRPGVSLPENFWEIYTLFGEFYCTFCERNINLANWILLNYHCNFILNKRS